MRQREDVGHARFIAEDHESNVRRPSWQVVAVSRFLRQARSEPPRLLVSIGKWSKQTAS